MRKSDKYILSSLIDAYTLKEVIEALAIISKEKTEEMCDNLLKEKAIDWSNYHVLLDQLSKKIKD